MRDASTLTVREIDGKEWNRGRIVPLSGSIGLSQLLEMVQAAGRPLEVESDAGLDDEHTGNHVIALPTLDSRAYFIVHAYALPLLQGYIGPKHYRDSPDPTPRLQPAT